MSVTTASPYTEVSDADLLLMTRTAVQRKLKNNCAAFSRLAGVSSALVTALVNQGRFPVEARVRHLVYVAAMAIIEGRVRVRPDLVRRTIYSPEGTTPARTTGTPKPRQLEVATILPATPTPALKSPASAPRSLFSKTNQVVYEPMARAFCQANVLVDPSYRVRTAALYARYTEWHKALVEDGSALPPLLSAQKFGAFIRLVHPTIVTGASRSSAWGREYVGVCLKPLPQEIVPDSQIPDSARPFQDPPLIVHSTQSSVSKERRAATLVRLTELSERAMNLAVEIEALRTELQGE